MRDADNFFWLVGLLEGEGSFLKPSPSKPNEPKIDIEMKDLDCIQRVAALFGLRYRTRDRKEKKNASITYHVRLTGRRAVQLMWRIRPYMSARRQIQIDNAIASYALRGQSYDPSVMPRFEFQPVCAHPLCARLVAEGWSRCELHKDSKNPSTRAPLEVVQR